ncbi:MAG: hypothetical protein KGL48_03410 [Sphingomonadales bacterium]|nr:hypothetical protein [Sphingomonadales bacterium]MDE2567948.1 hypothetical protein [Sphingomonadales bacterium]
MNEDAAPAGSGKLVRVVLGVTAIAYAALALATGADRLTQLVPATPALAGWTYDAGAARARGTFALIAGDPAKAAAFARDAIRADPLETLSISLLGQSLVMSKDYVAADKAYRVAGQLGWRDAVVQVYWMDQALQAGAYDVAAERLDALLRQTPLIERRNFLIGAVTATPEGRAALVNRLRNRPNWGPMFAGDVADLPTDQLLQRYEVVKALGPGVLDCRSTSMLANRLITLDEVAKAAEIWRISCGNSNSLVYDGGFEDLDTTRSGAAFDWRLSQRGDVYLTLGGEPHGNHWLQMEVSSSFIQPVLNQRVPVGAGSYRLSWDNLSDDAKSAQALLVSLSCSPLQTDAVTGVADPANPHHFTRELAFAGDCPAPMLTFWLKPGVPVRLDNVALAKQ